jgi:hypothetical protein
MAVQTAKVYWNDHMPLRERMHCVESCRFCNVSPDTSVDIHTIIVFRVVSPYTELIVDVCSDSCKNIHGVKRNRNEYTEILFKCDYYVSPTKKF